MQTLFIETPGDSSLMPLFFQQGFQHTNSMSSLLNICFQDGALEAKARSKDLCSPQKKENQNTQETPNRKKPHKPRKAPTQITIAPSICHICLSVRQNRTNSVRIVFDDDICCHLFYN